MSGADFLTGSHGSLEQAVKEQVRHDPQPIARDRNFMKRLAEAHKRAARDLETTRRPTLDQLKAETALRAARLCNSDALVLTPRMGGTAVMFLPLECGKKWCPTCVRTWSEQLTDRTFQSVARINPRTMRHLVLTIPSAPSGELHQAIRALAHAFREWRNQGRRTAHGGWWQNVAGHAWKMELDKKGTRAWHPHLHVLLHTPHGFDFRGHSRARDSWERITAGLGWPATRWAQYVTQCTSSTGAAAEVTKYAAKPLQLSALNVDDLIELARAAHGLRWTGGSGTIQPAPPRRGSENFIVEGRLSHYVERAQHGDRYALRIVRAWQQQATHSARVRANIPEEAMHT